MGERAGMMLLTELYGDDGAGLEGVDGVVIGRDLSPEITALPEGAVRVLLDRLPAECPEWAGQAGNIFCLEGLEETARARDAGGGTHRWLPRLVLEPSRPSYRFPERHSDDGFRYYVPDTAAIGTYRDRTGTHLYDLLGRAAALGFDALWLHAPAAEQTGSGYDLELLERAAACFGGGLWLSGGARTPRHLANLARTGEAVAAVLSETSLREQGPAAWRAALAPLPDGEPVRFASQGPPPHAG